jgi:hypothetical protein
MVIQTDKNLGPAIIDRISYVNYALNDHLLYTNTYQKLHKVAVQDYVRKGTDKLLIFIDKNFKPNSPERTYLERSLKKSMTLLLISTCWQRYTNQL